MNRADNYIKINENDNVVVTVSDVKAGTELAGVTVLADVDKGHKIALVDIKKDENIVKYGFPIGHATADIKAGEHVHVHNVKTNLKGVLDYSYTPTLSDFKIDANATFNGYKRADGQVGIRNEVWIVNTVGCVNKIAERIAAEANKKYAESDNFDGVHTFVHPFGCSQLGDDHAATQLILADMVKHPNAGAVLVLGLGCENNNIPEFKKVLGEYDEKRVKFLSTQDFDDEISASLELIDQLVEYATSFKREPVGADKLIVGLKCGGSDGFSGITANPLVGRFSDMLIKHGGTSILTEVPEMFGAETLLMNRCVNEEVFDKTVHLINDFKDYFTRHNQEIYENPSPGNKKGGITTLEDKSLGCTQKGGTSNVSAVLGYGERASVTGLNLLNGPGNDIVAITGIMASGAHIVLFTTGRGTPVGAPIPTVKISTNNDLYQRKGNWMDFNAGVLLEGQTMDDVSKTFFDYILKVASGEKTKNEVNGYREISIFKDGVTL